MKARVISSIHIKSSCPTADDTTAGDTTLAEVILKDTCYKL
jgi:hypothetical protein